MKNLKPLVLTLALAGVWTQAAARPLAEELQNLVERHPLILSSQKMVEAAEKGQDAARAGYYPKINVYGDTGREKIESRSYAPTVSGPDLQIDSSNATNPNSISDLNRTRFGVSIEQNLFAGQRTRSTVEIADVEQQLRQSELNNTVQNTLLDGIVAYMQIARLKTLLAVADLNETTTRRQLNLEDERMQRGGGIAVDVLQAKTRLQLARERKVLVEQNMRDASATYQQVFGHAPDLDTIEDVQTIGAAMPASLQQALESAMSANPGIAQSMLESRKAQKQISSEKSGYFPTIDLVGSIDKNKNVDQIESRKDASLLLRFNWNLFSGNETGSRVDAARKVFEATVDREAATHRKIEESVRMAWNQLENGRERQDLLKNAANIASEVMAFRKRLRDSGKETAINVLDAEVEYYSVLSNMINAEYDSKISFYRLLYAMGRMTPDAIGVGEGEFKIPTRPIADSISGYQPKS